MFNTDILSKLTSSELSPTVISSDPSKNTLVNRGAVISIKHPRIFEPVLLVVQKVGDFSIYVKMPEAFLRNNVLKGDVVTCHVLIDNYEYELTAYINDIEFLYPRHMRLVVERIRKNHNNRQFKRYLVNLPANLQFPDSNETFFGVIKNISANGIGVIFREHVDINSLVNVKVSTSIRHNETLEFNATILRAVPSDGYNEYGMKIIEIDVENKDKMDKLLGFLEEDIAKFVTDSLK